MFLALCGAPCPLKPLKKEGDGSFRPPPAVLVLFYAGISSVRVVSPALPTSGGRRCRPTQTVGLLERQHGGLCLASEDAVHAAAVKSSRFRIGATVTPTGETHYEILAPDIDVTVNPAADDSLDTVALTLPYADTGKHAYTPDWSKLPSGQT